MAMITSKKQLIKELADALSDHSFDGYDNFWYISITKQEINVRIYSEYTGVDSDPDDGEEIVKIDPLPSREGFEIMEEFVDAYPGRHQAYLYKALAKRHPFSAFRGAVENCGLLQQWYDWKNEAMKEKAADWMHFNDVDFKDGKIVALSTQTWFRDEDEDDEDGEENSSQ